MAIYVINNITDCDTQITQVIKDSKMTT